MLFFRKRSKTPDPQEGKMSNPWEKEKKSYQSTIEKLVARKADIYAHLGAAIAYQAKDDPAVLLPYPIQAAALNDIEQKQKRSGNEWHRRKASSSTRRFPGRKSVRAGHTARNRRDSAVYAVRQYIEVTRIRQPTTFRA